MSQAKVLVTGGTGFIGRQVLKILNSEDYRIIAPSSSELMLFNFNSVSEYMKRERPSHLLHLAWSIKPGEYLFSLDNFDWMIASMNLLKHFHANGGRRVIFTGTCFEYQYSNMPLKESDIAKPNAYYGKCKQRLSEIFTEYCSTSNMSGAWGRIFIAYGEHDNKKKLFPYLIQSLLKDNLADCSSGEQCRDLIYVYDVAKALVALLKTENAAGIYNIGTGTGVKLKEIILLAGKMLNKESLINLGAIKTRPDEPQYIIANVDKIYQATGWKAQVSYEEGLQNIINWLKNENN